MKAEWVIAGCLLLAASLHEFLWQLFAPDHQGDLRNVTALLPVAVPCFFLALVLRRRIVTAACVAAVFMQTTTAACSLTWLISPWVVTAGEDQCSRRWDLPMLLLSGLAALLVLCLWRPAHGSESG